MKANRAIRIALSTLVVAFVFAQRVDAALEVAVSVSPTEVQVGQPVDVQVRTFVPFGQDSLQLPLTRPDAYPAPSGLWNVLYPIDDYPFDVAANADDGTSIPVVLHLDATDATLWRGSFTPTSVGVWTVRLNNFAQDRTASVRVSAATPNPLPLGAAVIALVAGLALGIAFGRFRSRIAN
jgi:hypothetical protein